MSPHNYLSAPRTNPVRPFEGALLPYLGGKRRLAPLLFGLLAEVLPRARWREMRLLDPFCGGCSIALLAKRLGFEVSAADVAERAVVAARALVTNPSVRLQAHDLAWLQRAPAGGHPVVASSLEPRVFQASQAAFIDRGLGTADQRSEPTRSLLKQLVLKYVLGCFPMSLPSASDAKHAAAGDYDRISPARRAHYLRHAGAPSPRDLMKLAESVNSGVFGGRGSWRKGDARDVLASTPAEVVVLDPPYPGTSQYELAYALVDRLLGDEPPDRAPPTLEELLALSAEADFVVLCYGGPSATLGALTELVGRHRPVLRALEIPYARLAAIAKEETNDQSRELIVVAGR